MNILLETALFLIAIIFFVFPLGEFILNKLNLQLPLFDRLIIGLNIGMVIFTLLTFILWRLNLYNLSYIYAFITAGYLLYRIFSNKKNISDVIFNKIKLDIGLFGIIFIATIVPSLVVLKSGDVINDGIRLIGANSHDILSYLSIISELQVNVPPQNPVYSGELLRNYHYLTFIFMSGILSLTKISILSLYFKIIMPFLAFIFASSVYILVKKITQETKLGILAVLFTCLSSNAYYLIGFLYPSAQIYPSVFWVNEYLTRMVNPQLLMSYIVFLTLFYLLIFYKQIKDFKIAILIATLAGSLFLFKAFAGVIILSSLFSFTLYKIIWKDFKYVSILLIGIIITISLFFIADVDVSSSVFLSPFWFIKNMFESSDHLNYPIWELKRQTYLQHGNYLRIAELYVEGIVIFILGNLGIRIIGLFVILKLKKYLEKDILILLVIISVVGAILPQLFLTKGTVWNSIQFFYYTVFCLGILTPIVLGRFLIRKNTLFYLVFILLWLSLTPGVFYISKEYFFKVKDTYSYGPEIYKAANSLKDQPGGVVLLAPEYTDNSFVTAISKKNSFYADEMWLSVQRNNFSERKNEVQDFFNSSDIKSMANFINNNNIRYIFTGINSNPNLAKLNLQKIYYNNSIVIYQVR